MFRGTRRHATFLAGFACLLAGLGLAAFGTPLETDTERASAHPGPDLSAPVPYSLGFPEGNLRMKAAGISFSVDLGAADPAGVSYAALYLVSPTERQHRGAVLYQSVGSFQLQLPYDAEAGRWRVESLRLRDGLGNERVYAEGDLTRLGLRTTLEVVPGEKKKSALRALSLSPGTLDVAGANVELEVRLNLPTLNLHYAVVRLRGPVEQTLEQTLWPPALTGKLVVPRGSEAGDWKLEVALVDEQGHLRLYSTPELRALGFPHTISVKSSSKRYLGAPDPPTVAYR